MSDNIINNDSKNLEIPETVNSHPLCPLCWILIQEIRKCSGLTEETSTGNYVNPCRLFFNQDIQNNIKTNSNVAKSLTVDRRNSSTAHDHISVIIRDELKRFCENTTIRGLPRIVRSHNRYLRFLWLSLVCILVLGCFACMFFLARQYLEYNVIHPPRVLRHTSSPFPSVTVCNFRPISPDGLKYLQMNGWKTPRQFVLDMAAYAQHMFYNKQKMEEYNAASAAFSLAGFLESLPNNEERRKLGYQHNKLIIKCQITYLNGSKPVAAPCERKGVWRKFIHAQYLNCATFEPYSYLRSDTTNIEMYIYLDEMLQRAHCVDCFHGEVKSQLSGALISIHGADILPNINDKSINLKPGTLTELRLSIVENIQQMPPYGRCSMNHPINLQLHDMIYNYSEYACRQATIQNEINQRCGCYSMEYPYNEHTGYEPCTGLSQFINISSCNRNELSMDVNSLNSTSKNEACKNELKKFVARMMCKRSVIENYVHGALPSCTMPCSFYSYESEQSTSTWPTKSWQLTWLNSSYNKRLGVFKGAEFEPYHEAQRLLEAGNETEAGNILEKTNVLERKLLAVLINRPNFDVRKVEEKEVLSLTSLLSQTGGLFSIWIGLSMISLGEVFEMCIRCYIRAKHSKRSSAIFQDDPVSIEQCSCRNKSSHEHNDHYQMSDTNYHLLCNALSNYLICDFNTNKDAHNKRVTVTNIEQISAIDPQIYEAKRNGHEQQQTNINELPNT
ncbi:unnamed protein product [Heterobilharzia americana]|nr:unnamed protein product [Heterobilharzia americana]CAH8558821.1 unnamed protein product [Heterobilharzia americana]